jgi:glutathione S-transferase
MKLTLYYAPGGCSMAAHIVLEEIGVEYQAVRIDLKKRENLTPEFAAVNPRKQVPVLVMDGEILTEDIAILLTLAALFPDRGLISAKTREYARTVEWLSFFATTIHPRYTELVYPSRHSTDPSHAGAIRAKAREALTASFADVEAHLKGDYLVGDRFSLADAHLFVFANWGRRGQFVDGEKTPNIFRWYEQTKQRPSVWRMLQKEGLAT